MRLRLRQKQPVTRARSLQHSTLPTLSRILHRKQAPAELRPYPPFLPPCPDQRELLPSPCLLRVNLRFYQQWLLALRQRRCPLAAIAKQLKRPRRQRRRFMRPPRSSQTQHLLLRRSSRSRSCLRPLLRLTPSTRPQPHHRLLSPRALQRSRPP